MSTSALAVAYLVVAVLSFVACASQGWENCTQHFYLSRSPSFVNGSTSLCRGGCFAVSYDAEYQNPSWAAYRITQADTRANIPGRISSFHRDPDLMALDIVNPNPSSSVFSTEWNRGHLAPSQILSYTNDAKYQTYATSNIAPQWWQFNQQPWQAQEQAIFDWINNSANADAELYIVTGVGYADRDSVTMSEGIATPTYYFAALCDPATNQSVAFLGLNQQDGGGLLKTYRSVDDVAGTVFCGASLNSTRGGDGNGTFQIFSESCATSSVNASHWNFAGYNSYPALGGANCSNGTSRPAPAPSPAGSSSASDGSSSSQSDSSASGSSTSGAAGSSSSSAQSSSSSAASDSSSSSVIQSQGSTSSSSSSAEGSSSASSSSDSSSSGLAVSPATTPQPPQPTEQTTQQPSVASSSTSLADVGSTMDVGFVLRLSGQMWGSLLPDADIRAATMRAVEEDLRTIFESSDSEYVATEKVVLNVTGVSAGSLVVQLMVAADLSPPKVAQTVFGRLRTFVEQSLSATGAYSAAYNRLVSEYRSAGVAKALISDPSQADAVVCISLRLVDDPSGVPSSTLQPASTKCSTACIIGLSLVGVAVLTGFVVMGLLLFRCCSNEAPHKNEPTADRKAPRRR